MAGQGQKIGLQLAVLVLLAAAVAPVAKAAPLAAATPAPGSAVECLALNIYHEARGEPFEGKVAVAHVVLNRMNDGRFPADACAVVRQGGDRKLHRCQFSWWCDGRSNEPRELAAWKEAVTLAQAVSAGKLSDPTGGALWYHADYVQPKWSAAFARGPVIGRHIFYRRPAAGQTASRSGESSAPTMID